MRERISDWVRALTRTQRTALGFVILFLVVILGAGAVFALSSPDTTAPGPRTVIEDVRSQVDADLSAAILRLPPQVVRTFEGGGLQGTLAITDKADCIGFRLTVGEDYVVSGDQDAVTVGAIENLPAAACTMTALQPTSVPSPSGIPTESYPATPSS